MLELFMKHPEYLIPTVAIVSGAALGLVAIVMVQWRGMYQASLDASLKQDMLNRGMSVEDIERVLRASATPPTEPTRPDPISDNEYYLVEKLVDEGKSAEEVERIVRLFRGEGSTAIKQRNLALPV